MGGRSNLKFKDYYNVSRMEYLPAEAPAIFIPLLLTATTLWDLLNPLYFEAVLAFALLYFAGFIINSYTDVKVDQRYKIYVASSSQKMGPKLLKNLVIAQVAIAIVLIFHISWSINALWLIPICLIGIFMGLAYSIKPFEFKIKGILHTISLMTSAFLVPFILLYSTASSNFGWYIILLFIGFSITHYGIALANQTGDFLEDTAEGLQSPAVKWGLNKTLRLAKLMSFVGLCMELVALFGVIWYAPWVVELDAALGLAIPAKYLIMLLITVVLAIAYSVPLRGLFLLHNISKQKINLTKRMNTIKKKMNYPIWQAAGIWGLVVCAGIIMTCNIMFGV